MNKLDAGEARTTLYIVLAVCVGLLTFALADLIRDVDRTVLNADAAVVETQRRVKDTAQNLNADLIQLGLTLDQVRQASIEERSYWQKTAKESAATVRAVRQLVDRTDRSLNDELVPQASSALRNVNEQVTQLGNAAVELELVEGDLDRQVQNPDIAATVASLKLSAGHLAKTSASLEASAADAEKYVHRMTKPASAAKQVGLAIANFFGHVLGGWL